jgi:hypothetical protein
MTKDSIESRAKASVSLLQFLYQVFLNSSGASLESLRVISVFSSTPYTWQQGGRKAEFTKVL